MQGKFLMTALVGGVLASAVPLAAHADTFSKGG